MKYPFERGIMCIVREDKKTTRECYTASLKLYPHSMRRKVNRSEVAMADLDHRINIDDR